MARGTTDAWLRRAVGDLKRRGIRLAVEEGPLRPTEDCGLFVEGFAGDEGVAVAQRVKDAGGTLRYLAYDEPYYYASIYDGPQACHWSAERIAGEIAAYNEEIRGVFGAIKFGDTEPLTSALDVPRYKAWIDTYRRVAGERLAFFQVDGSYETAWGAGADAPQWLEIDLGAPATIGQLRLVVAQSPAGETHHVVYGRDAAGALRVLAELRGETGDGDVLTITPPAPWAGIRAIRIETVSSPSWVAWREVEAWSW